MHQKLFTEKMREEESFLSINEAAEILKTSTSTLKRWVRQGTLIAHRSDQGIRFCRKELDQWMKKAGMSGKSRTCSSTSKCNQNTGLYGALQNGKYISYTDTVSRDTLYREIAEQASDNILEPFSASELFKKMVEREKSVATTITSCVAVPHPKRRGEQIFRESQIFTVKLNHPIALNSSAPAETSILFFLFASDPAEHLKLLAQLVKKITKTDNFIDCFKKTDSMDSFMEILKKSDQ